MGSRADLLTAAPRSFEGRLRAVVHKTYALDDAPVAHRVMEASKHFGE
jgi:NADPH:quinone reductase-like Zn-dependent oxidoreductase